MSLSRVLAATTTAALLVVGLAAPTQAGPAARSTSPESSQVVLDWQRTSSATVYPLPTTPIPTNVPLLGFTSLAMYDAARAAERRGVSQAAAVATAAHDVLTHYVPSAAATLDARLEVTLAGVPDGRSQERGEAVGARVAHRLIAQRAEDGLGDASIVYDRDPAPGVWQPVPNPAPPNEPGEPPVPMLGAWLGYLRPLVVTRPVRVDGPDALTSSAYARDFAEVKAIGSSTGSGRTDAQTATARFFNINPAVMYGDALVRHLEARPLGLTQTARLFAAMHVAMTDSLITCWRLKHEVGLWRPFQAIAGAASDGNPATEPQAGWTSLLPNPPYSDYPSGHGCLTAPAMEVLRQTLGEGTSLTLRNSALGTERTYPTLSALERDALESRIWGGLHFRDAMDDAYAIGREVADRVVVRLH
ncbi:vanadium-dependent haloperoxidase [Cellulomonas aerilata]|uniref:Haloperoxidase n=1 Tax=Cellulomonas aerilata TaxID=515326 RepID=A0A512D742_9CELL|nr:vanadium-dependent haloperoxidase [Cellulomonas aerilata]GEO32301.1 haloperoxidase [Cellulomonas aerilata]